MEQELWQLLVVQAHLSKVVMVAVDILLEETG
jgi:hypothetical protein